MEQQAQKRPSLGEDESPAKKFKSGPELPGIYSDAVRKKLQSASRTGQACDRCKERKMRCDPNPAGCGACQLKNLRCVTTDRITGRPSERGQSDRLQVELMDLRRHLAAYQQKYGHMDDAELAASDAYQNVPTPTAYLNHHTRPFEPPDSQLAASCDKNGPHYGPIHGTMVDIFDGEIDIADFHSPDMAESGHNSGPVYNHSTSSFVRTIGGAQRPDRPTLPPKEEALKLIENYLKTLNTYVPLLHGPSVMELSRKYFEDPAFKASNAETAIVILILANMYYQHAVRNPATVAKEKMKESNHMFHYILSLYNELSLDHSLTSMQAMALLLLHARILPKPGYVWHFSMHILTRAIGMGWHQKPGSSLNSNAQQDGPLAIEMRKRVFWSILSINVATATKLGRPMPLRLADIDVEPITPLEDSEISDDGIVARRSGKCEFWPGIYFHKLQPLLMELYNNFISIRKPSAEYVKNLETLNAKIINYRRDWAKDIAAEAQDGSMVVATHHIDDWSAEFELVLHHPRLCTSESPKVMEQNLEICHKAAARMLSNANSLFHIFRGVDFTWHSTVGYVCALGVTLHIHRQRIHQVTRETFDTMRLELNSWLTIMKVADQVLRTGELYQRRFKPLIENVINEAQNVLLASSAVQNGYQQNQIPHRNGDRPSVNQPQPQPPAPSFAQSNGWPNGQSPYPPATHAPMPAAQSTQPLPVPTPASIHPPLYPEPYQHPQPPLAVSDNTAFQPHHHPAYPSTSIPYPPHPQHDGQQPAHLSAQQQLLGAASYMTYQQQPQSTNQHADALLSLGQVYDDPNNSALWPNAIHTFMQQQQHQQGHHPGSGI